MPRIPSLDKPGTVRPWWMTAVVTGQASNAFLPLSHLGALPRGPILLSLADYLADTASTSAGDPGAGNLRWNHATQASATEIYIDDADADAVDHSALWATISNGGGLYLYNPDDLDVWQQWQVDGATDAAGYLALAVTLVASNGSFGDDDPVVVTIQQPFTAGLGDVEGPADSVDDRLALFDGTSGKKVKQAPKTYNEARIHCFPVACSDEVTNLSAGAAKTTFHMPYDFTLVEVFVGLTTPQPSGAIFTVDVNEGSVSILSTKITIDNTEETSLTAATPPVISDTSLAKGAKITVDVDQVGAAGAKGLKVYLVGYPT